MRRALLISPHFPPDSSAGTHRVRLLAPYLESYGWDPTVLTVHESAYEGELDPELPHLITAPLRVERASALPAALTRKVGIGDLGLRSFRGLYRKAAELLSRERFDVIFITIFPAYTALLGSRLGRKFHVPFVLDYQDPWVGAWGDTVGGGKGGRIDLKSRASRALAEWLEPRAVRDASAITAVSAGTLTPILERNPTVRPITEAIPIGAEPSDFTNASSASGLFDPADGLVHICYVGALLPLGAETLRAVLQAARLVRDRNPELFRRIRFHFVGTSNQTTAASEMRVEPIARALGVGEIVQELPKRVPYTRAVRIQRDATVLLGMGSSERHYTASKIYPMLLARRPALAVYHESSTVVDVLRKVSRAPSVRLVTYSDVHRAEASVEQIHQQLSELATQPVWSESDINGSAMSEFFAKTLAGKLANVFDRVVERQSERRAA